MAKILYCDDNHTWRETMTQYLSFYGHEVKGIAQGPDVTQEFHREKYDMVICNAREGAFDGFSLCHQMRRRQEESLKDMPVLMIGVEPLDHDEYRFLRKHQVYFMTKYTGPEEWFEKINNILSHS